MDTICGNLENTPADRAGNVNGQERPEILTQATVREIMSHARTLEQIAAAWQVRSEYLRANPDDEAILEEGESLWMLEQALKHPDAQMEAAR